MMGQNHSLSIHSCNIYVPHKFSALSRILGSLNFYVQQRGWEAVSQDATSLVRAEVLGLSPYPQLEESVAGKHLLMVGGAKISVAFARAKQLGLKVTLVDDASLESVRLPAESLCART
jgi:hypothetical protein